MKIVTIELTTKCNFACDYCYSKHYDDRMMSFDYFKDIVDQWADHVPQLEFNLSGEGESLLHPQFWDFVRYIKQTTPHAVSVTSTGTTLTESNRINAAKYLDKVKVSIDTMDAELSHRVGRLFHDRVIANVRELAKVHRNITIMSVDYGQNLVPVYKFVKSIQAHHFIQPLAAKTDYATSYTLFAPPPKPTYPDGKIIQCPRAHDPWIVYRVAGDRYPCWYIKDTSKYPGYDKLVAQLTDPTNTAIPPCCEGCMLLASM